MAVWKLWHILPEKNLINEGIILKCKNSGEKGVVIA